MMRLNSWIWAGPFGSLGLLWYECREDLSLFCYRIGCGALTEVRSRALEFAPISQALSTLSKGNLTLARISPAFAPLCLRPRGTQGTNSQRAALRWSAPSSSSKPDSSSASSSPAIPC